MAVNYLIPGQSPKARYMNDLFEAFDAKLAKLLNNSSPFYLFNRGAVNGVLPSFTNIDTTAHLFFGPRFYILGPDYSTSSSAGAASMLHQIMNAGTPQIWAYDHDIFTDWVATAPLDTSRLHDQDDDRKLIRLQQATGTEYALMGRNSDPWNKVAFLDYSLGICRRDVSGEPYQVIETTTEYDTLTQAKVDCVDPWICAEVVFDGQDDFAIDWPATYDKHLFYRFHNLNVSEITISFIGTDDLVKHTLVIPARQCRCVRREGVDGPYLNGGKYFQRFQPDDPRSYRMLGKIRNLVSSVGPWDEYAANNVVNPWIISAYVQLLHRLWQNKGYDTDSLLIDTIPAFYIDPELFWRAEEHFCATQPVPSANRQPWVVDLTDLSLFGPLADTTKLGDLLYHTGRLELVATTGSGRVNIPFIGIDDFITNASGWGITVSYDGSNQLVLNATGKDLVTVSTNLLLANSGAPVRTITDLTIPNVSALAKATAFEGVTFNTSYTYYGHDANGALTTTTTETLTQDKLQAKAPTSNTALVIHDDTVADTEALTWLGASSEPETAYDAHVRFTGFGPILNWRTSVSHTSFLHNYPIISRRSNTDLSLAAGALVHSFTGCVHLGGLMGWPSWYRGTQRSTYIGTGSGGTLGEAGDGLGYDFQTGLFYSARTERYCAPREFLMEVGSVPVVAKMFYDLMAPLQEPNFYPYTQGIEFAEDNIGPTVKDMGELIELPHIAFLGRPSAPESNIFLGLGVWVDASTITHDRPGWSPTTFDLSGSNNATWWSANRTRLLTPTSAEIDGYYRTMGNIWRSIYQYFVPIALEHYNNLASLVNSIREVRPISFEWFYGGENQHIADTGGGVVRGIYGTTIRPKDAYRCWLTTGASLHTLFTNLGVTIHDINELPVDYDLMFDEPRKRIRAKFNYTYVFDVVTEDSVTYETDTPAGTIFDQFKSEIFSGYSGSAYTEFYWVTDADVRACAAGLGLASLRVQLVEPVKFAIAEIDVASKLAGSFTHDFTDFPFGPASATLNTAWIEAKRLWLRPCEEGDTVEWVRSIGVAGAPKLINKPAPDIMTARYAASFRPNGSPAAGGWRITYDYVVRYHFIDADTEQYTRDNWMSTVSGIQAEVFLSAIGIIGGERTHKVSKVPAAWLDAGTEFSLSSTAAAKAKVINPAQKMIPVDSVAAHGADITLQDVTPDEFLYGTPNEAWWINYHLTDTENVL